MTIEKLDATTPDQTRQNIARLAELFPECVTEGPASSASDRGEPVIDFDLLRQALADHLVEGPQERYRLDWPGKRQALLTANAPIDKTLRPMRDDSVDFDTTRNMFIEGDNLDTLKLLQETYLGKVKLIYIDPPYNTGKDFIYKDNFSQSREEYEAESGQRDEEGGRLVANLESNGRFHSDWLCMIYPRLRLARTLLEESGFIFIAVDVLELSNVISIGKDIFGHDSCVGVISRATGTRMGSGSRGIARELDYMVVFSRHPDSNLTGLLMSEQEMALYDQEDDKGRYLTRSLRRTGGENRREDRPTMYFAVQDPDGGDVFPVAPEGYESRWVCSKDTYNKLVRDGDIEWKRVTRGGVTKWQVYQKHYLKGGRKEVSDLWSALPGNKKGTKEVSELFNKVKLFDHPKPVDLLRQVIKISTDVDSAAIVMDFFAGSGTTGAAVLEQNADDGGNRRFILVQFPEEVAEGAEAKRLGFSNIAEVTRERLRRAGRAVTTPSKCVGWNGDVGFRAFRIDSGNFQDTRVAPDQATQATLDGLISHIRDDRTDEDLLFGALLRWGVDVTLPVRRDELLGQTIWIVDPPAVGEGGAALIACFARPQSGQGGIDTALADAMAALKPLRVLFRDDGFVSDAAKENIYSRFKQRAPDTAVRVL